VAIRQSVIWKGYYEKVSHFGLGLQILGLKRGDKPPMPVTTGWNGYILNWLPDFCGGAVIGIYLGSHLDQVEYGINHSNSIWSSPKSAKRKVIGRLNTIREEKDG